MRKYIPVVKHASKKAVFHEEQVVSLTRKPRRNLTMQRNLQKDVCEAHCVFPQSGKGSRNSLGKRKTARQRKTSTIIFIQLQDGNDGSNPGNDDGDKGWQFWFHFTSVYGDKYSGWKKHQNIAEPKNFLLEWLNRQLESVE